MRPDPAAALPGLDLPRFLDWYARVEPGDLGDTAAARVLAGGKSNLTYEVHNGRTRRVLRRPPLGHVLATAHDMQREFRVLTALEGSSVPTPRTRALCTDLDVLGAPFYVMDHVSGSGLRHAADVENAGGGDVARLVLSSVDLLAQIHTLDPGSVGLDDFGRPEGFLRRQVARWGHQMDLNRTRDLPDSTRLLHRLTERAGADVPRRHGLIHGDFRLDNLLVDDGMVRAVIDWEMSTLGDPMTDVALHLVYDAMPQVCPGPGVATASLAVGYPDAATKLERYAHLAGDLVDLPTYLGLAYFKLATILEGIRTRHLRGLTVGDGFAHAGDAVEPLLAAGLDALASTDGRE